MSEAELVDAANRRLEALFPGLTAFVAQRRVEAAARVAAFWANVRPERRRLRAAPERPVVFDLDPLVEYAGEIGALVEWRFVHDSLDFADVAPSLRALTGRELLVVPHCEDCLRTTVDAVLAAADLRVAGADVLFIGMSAPEVVVVQHDGWLGVLRGSG
ncbi:hypothetical protein [Nannocystis punicea]|uniref:Uncharacterized protein n=1 Tax=Nannocystis punicea TaxID=2995304 RepID=A0ABY7H2Y5_9BACT|nr:hypothetical protein [Nannocystis poenicansa]WAS93623.1 hypothetical protein O0S08_46420 [Nannocystis poenicansa]